MPRPSSILRFERLYLASIGLGLVGWAVAWKTLARRLAADPATAPFGWLLPVAVVLGTALTVALLYLVARRGSAIAKWIVVVLTVLAVLRFAITLPAAARGMIRAHELLLSLVTLALSVAATLQLFRPDARQWFGETVEGDAA